MGRIKFNFLKFKSQIFVVFLYCYLNVFEFGLIWCVVSIVDFFTTQSAIRELIKGKLAFLALQTQRIVLLEEWVQNGSHLLSFNVNKAVYFSHVARSLGRCVVVCLQTILYVTNKNTIFQLNTNRISAQVGQKPIENACNALLTKLNRFEYAIRMEVLLIYMFFYTYKQSYNIFNASWRKRRNCSTNLEKKKLHRKKSTFSNTINLIIILVFPRFIN